MIATFTAALLLSVASQAMINPFWEKPYLRANLKPIEGSHEVRILTLNQREDSETPTSVTLTEISPIYCVTTPCPQPTSQSLLYIVKSETECGSEIYHAEGWHKRPTLGPRNSTKEEWVELVLMDNKHRICDDLRPARWEVSITENGNTKQYLGEPHSAITALNFP